jgi:uncharacterized protein (TIGR01244 family)
VAPHQFEADFAASSQLAESDLPQVAALGFRTVVCNRLDAEDPDQRPSAELADPQ